MSFKMVKQADTNTSGRQDTFIYDVVETIVDDKIYAELIWDFQNVDSLTINNEPAPHAGFKKMLIDKTIRMKFQYTDSKGNTSRFKGGRISKQAIIAAGGIAAAIDDGLLDISFRVLGFETMFVDNMGNVVPEVSNTASFTPNQLARIRSLSRGKLFNISHIRVVGPDGIERTLTSPVEVIIN